MAKIKLNLACIDWLILIKNKLQKLKNSDQDNVIKTELNKTSKLKETIKILHQIGNNEEI